MNTADSTSGATAQLASFVQATEFQRLPASARHAGRRALVNIVGCCVGGAAHEITDTATRALLPYSGPSTATVLGRHERADILTATLLNGVSSAAYSFDDTHGETILHPTGAVASTLLALAEQQPLRGEEFLLALVLGIDVAARVSKAVSTQPAAGDIGWSQTGLAAGIGAAAAAAKALRLDVAQTTWAIGIAASQASGFREAHGSMAATLIFGHAAQGGLRAALLARQGLSGPAAPLEGKYGFARLFAHQPHLAHLTDALGQRFEIEALAYKPYPCGVVIHPAVDAALAWHRSSGQPATSIEQVRMRAHPAAVALGFRRHPAGVFEAKVSYCHWVAAALAMGRAGLAQGQQQVIDDPAVARLRDAIHVEGDDTVPPDAATMIVTLKDGRSQRVDIAHCKGSVANPMSDADLVEKFEGQAHLQLSPARAATLLERCWEVDQLPDAGEIARLARSHVAR